MKKTYRDRHASSIKCTFLQDTCLRARGCSKSSLLLYGYKGFAYQILAKSKAIPPLRSLSATANVPRTDTSRTGPLIDVTGITASKSMAGV